MEQQRKTEDTYHENHAGPPIPPDTHAPTFTSRLTRAQQLLKAVGRWPSTITPQPVSAVAQALTASGYRSYASQCGQDECVLLILKQNDHNVVEVKTLIAYPDRRGNGRTTMQRLCVVADELEVRLWLNAEPFGGNRDHIPSAKLRSFYASFGFRALTTFDAEWLAAFRRWGGTKVKSAMIRHPRYRSAANGDG